MQPKINLSRIALTFLLGIVFLPSGVFAGEASRSQSAADEHDMSSENKIFSNYVRDFQAVENTVQGDELEATRFLEDVSSHMDERLYALNTTLKIYDALSPFDKTRVKSIVKEQLAAYTYLIDYDSDRVAGIVSFLKVPATAQMGLKMKDQMRAAKEKLDTIASSL
jgi:hypothetical protein